MMKILTTMLVTSPSILLMLMLLEELHGTSVKLISPTHCLTPGKFKRMEPFKFQISINKSNSWKLKLMLHTPLTQLFHSWLTQTHTTCLFHIWLFQDTSMFLAMHQIFKSTLLFLMLRMLHLRHQQLPILLKFHTINLRLLLCWLLPISHSTVSNHTNVNHTLLSIPTILIELLKPQQCVF